MSKGNSMEFYYHDQEVIDRWIDAMKDSVILLDLKEDYHIGSLIGKGNFAKVHMCKKKKTD
jgi:hypothetical protein